MQQFTLHVLSIKCWKRLVQICCTLYKLGTGVYVVGEIHSRFIPFADYYRKFLEPARDITPMRLLEVPGLCTLGQRIDTAVQANGANLPDDVPSHTTGLFSFFDTVPGTNPAERDIRNTFTSVPLCVAFTVGTSDLDPDRYTLLYSGPSSPLLVAGETIELTVGGRTAVFNYNITASGSRGQVCFDGTSAILYRDCEEVQRIPFTVSSSNPINSIGVLGTPLVLENAYIVS